MMTRKTNRNGMQNINGKKLGRNVPVMTIETMATAAITTNTTTAMSCGVVLRRGATGYQLCDGGGGDGGGPTVPDGRVP